MSLTLLADLDFGYEAYQLSIQVPNIHADVL